MRLLRSGSRVPAPLGWLAAGAIGIAVVAGGIGYGIAQLPAASLLDGLTHRASAQEAPTTTAVARRAGPAATGALAAGAANAANPRKPTGTVTQVTADPASFTLKAPDGTLTTFSVLPTTVFMAGRDRPYHFGLLKTGDTVVVRGGAQGQAQGQEQAQATNRPAATASPLPVGAGNAATVKPKAAGRAGARAASPANSGEPIARIVVVRPAGEGGRLKNGQPGAAQNGGSDGAGQ